MATLSSWTKDGKPVKYAQPVADLAQTLRAAGYTVYLLGDDSHLRHVPPEDHTPYSATGWPVANPYPYVHACDIMPPPAGKGLPSLTELGARLAADRNAGVAGASWIKYMNWTTAANRCVHESWAPNHAVANSTDKGHIHISCRTDFTHSTVAAKYNPLVGIHTPTSASVAAPPFVKELRRGLTDPQVGVWQRQMKSRGWSISVDNSYGPDSETVCRKFQAQKGLTVDGIVGPKTWRASWVAPVT